MQDHQEFCRPRVSQHTQFVINPAVILRDESRFCSSGAYIARMASPCERTLIVDATGFELLVYLCDVKTWAEIIAYYSNITGEHSSTEVPLDLHNLMLKLVADEFVCVVADGQTYVPPTRKPYLDTPTDFHYKSLHEPYSFPTSVAFVPTAECNLKCRHCQAVYDESDKKLSWDEIEKLFDELDENGVFVLKLTGGEVLLHPRFEEIIRYAVGKRFAVELLTNGTLLNSDIVSLFAECGSVKGTGFIVASSIDGATADTHEWMRGAGSFNELLRGLKLLRDAGVRFLLTCVLTRKNMHELETIGRLAMDLGALSLGITPPRALGRALKDPELAFLTDEIDRIEKEVRAMRDRTGMSIGFNRGMNPFVMREASSSKHDGLDVKCEQLTDGVEKISLPSGTCPAGIATLAISEQGIVYPCIDAMTGSVEQMGTIREKTLVELWRYGPWSLYRGGFRVEDLEGCSNCASSRICRYPRCRAYPAAALGNKYGPMPECLRNFRHLGVSASVARKYMHKMSPVFDGNL